jgi:DNA topoisomerase-1
VLNGPYGPYITDGKKNARIAKTTDPATITEEQAKQLLAEAPAKKGGFRRRKSAGKTKK